MSDSPIGLSDADRGAVAERHPRQWWSRADASATALDGVADPVIGLQLADESRAASSRRSGRSAGRSELKVAGTFAAITNELIQHGATDTVLKIVARAVREEVHHAEISFEMAARYRRSDVQWTSALPVPVPEYEPADAHLRATLLVVTMCCINETLACAILERQLAQVKSPLARAAAQTILTDEIHHARAGWAHVSSPHVTAPMKRELARWLPRLLTSRLSALLDDDTPFTGEEFTGHGVVTRKARQQIVAYALRDVMLPGFASAGIDVSHAQAWARTALADS